MKALKEKRVSLRSLFRRSLVILSILALALAFGSCSSDSGSGSEVPTGEPTEPPTPVIPAPVTVLNMTVLKHPINPSFEGAYPDLTGLEVLVKWTNGDQKIVTDTSLFTVYPPVAFVDAADTHLIAPSPKGRYAIQYIGDEGIYDLNVYRVNVYLPAVFAIATGATDEGMKVKGKITAAYEDQGIDATGLEYEAQYKNWDPDADFGSYPFAPDSYYTSIEDFAKYNKDKSADGSKEAWRERWGKFENLFHEGAATLGGGYVYSNPISSNPEAWIVNARPADDSTTPYTATYLADLNAPKTSPKVTKEVVEITKFYRVDRLSYVSGIENVPTIAADDPDLKGDNNTSAPENWWKVLRAADLKFKVIYYRLPGDEDAAPTRDISMADYVRAMYLVDENNKPRASLPILGGNTVTGGVAASGVQHSVLNDYPLSLSLFYYSPLITGAIGKGTVAASDYLNANAASIPITDSGLIATFTGFTKERIDITAHPSEKGGEPVISGSVQNTEIEKRTSLYDQLKRYYKVNWTYENPRDASKPVVLKVDWPASHTAITDVDFTDIEAEETRQCSVTFPSPGSSPGDDDEVEFDYIVKP